MDMPEGRKCQVKPRLAMKTYRPLESASVKVHTLGKGAAYKRQEMANFRKVVHCSRKFDVAGRFGAHQSEDLIDFRPSQLVSYFKLPSIYGVPTHWTPSRVEKK